MKQVMDRRNINAIKCLAIDMIKTAGSGHPGIALGAAPIIYSVYKDHLFFDSSNPDLINRDRFVLSAGHGSALLYATLYMFGYDLNVEDLKRFRRIDSITPGHPEFGVTPGVEVTTGPLGQGLANAVGMAIGAKVLGDKFGNVLKNNIYVLCGDGDLMEGVSMEASSIAGTLELDNLIVLYDSNGISLDGKTCKTFTENVGEKFKAMGWDYELVREGNSYEAISKAISNAKKNDRPTLIEVKTIIGDGSMIAATNEVHGKPLSDDDINQIKKTLLIPDEDFFIPTEDRDELLSIVNERIKPKLEKDAIVLEEINPLLDVFYNKEIDIKEYIKDIKIKELDATRVINGEIMQELSRNIPSFIGGSADLSSSTKTYIDDAKDMLVDQYDGKNIWFGVREHAMGSILNGLSLYGFKTYGSTFLTFADYLKPAIRLSAIMNLPVTYIFTHDSINIGQDGPTHQPIEQLSMLRSIPNMSVFRPADAREVAGSWNHILRNKIPACLILSRQESPSLNSTSSSMVSKGAYIVRREKQKLNGIIIATGSEVSTALSVANNLFNNKGIDIRVISMPSVDLFLKQPLDYKKEILPINVRKVVLEAASSYGWHRFVYSDDYLITIDNFGASGTPNEVLDKMDFSYDKIKERIENLLK